MVPVGHNRDDRGVDFIWEAMEGGAGGKDSNAVLPFPVVVQAAENRKKFVVTACHEDLRPTIRKVVGGNVMETGLPTQERVQRLEKALLEPADEGDEDAFRAGEGDVGRL